jgi:hypothetical protein
MESAGLLGCIGGCPRRKLDGGSGFAEAGGVLMSGLLFPVVVEGPECSLVIPIALAPVAINVFCVGDGLERGGKREGGCWGGVVLGVDSSGGGVPIGREIGTGALLDLLLR